MTDPAPAHFLSTRAGRCRLLALAFALWTLIIVLKLSQIMILQRDRYVAEMSRESWREGTIPPLRGRLLDRNGTPLAWSTRHFALIYHVPDNPALIETDIVDLARLLPAIRLPLAEIRRPGAPREIHLKQAISPEEAEVLGEICRKLPRLRLGSYFVRHTHPNRQIRKRLGQVKNFRGLVIGISGQEKEQDHLLRGCPGKFRIMVDRKGNWLPQTWQKVRELRPGYDVYLPLLAENGDRQP